MMKEGRLVGLAFVAAIGAAALVVISSVWLVKASPPQVSRFDDSELGVVCYFTANGQGGHSISCLMVGR